MTAEAMPEQRPKQLWPRMAGWVANDSRYDYEYAPRVEHYFDGTSEYSYCGMIGIWSTARRLSARRRCLRCVMRMLRDGLLRVVEVRRGAW